DPHALAYCSWSLLLEEHLEECPLCLLSQPRCHFPRLTSCSHRACSDCLRQYLRIEISESRVGIACPQCPETLAPLDVRAILDDRALLERFEEYQLRRFLASDPDTRWCPAPDCRLEMSPKPQCPKLSCGREGCETEFCYHCRQLWHPNQTCDQARRQRARHTSGGNDPSTLYVFNEDPDAEEIKACPRCGAYIMKTNDGSCNRMNCTVCACQFCWLCMQEITDVHYLSMKAPELDPCVTITQQGITHTGVKCKMLHFILNVLNFITTCSKTCFYTFTALSWSVKQYPFSDEIKKTVALSRMCSYITVSWRHRFKHCVWASIDFSSRGGKSLLTCHQLFCSVGPPYFHAAECADPQKFIEFDRCAGRGPFLAWQ
uniref:RBR-type E3 ubiquitin transferase n=1 Tax=Salarias fasciatus TaxID=181472 RepID=A0A672FD19_SALFA